MQSTYLSKLKHEHKNETSIRITYPFVDLIRFVSMVGIVWAHTDAFPSQINIYNFLSDRGDVWAYIAFKQLFKFSAVCFFMISGFLLSDKMNTINPFEYFKRRIGTTFKSYVIAFSIFIGLLLIANYFFYKRPVALFEIPQEMFYVLFYTPYWFLPTYYIGLLTIIIFSKYLYSWKLGAALLTVTLVFTFSHLLFDNLLDRDHTTSVFAFVFYIWLGAYIRNKSLIEKIRKIPVWSLVVGLIITYLLACYQSLEMFNNGNTFFFNNLRLYNQIYGLLFFLFLIVICPKKPKFRMLNPRKETFGIYLYHFYFVAFIFPVLLFLANKYLGFTLYNQPMALILFYSLIHFILAYVFTLVFVKWCIRNNIPIT